jgi:hypothetical protein
MQGKVPLLICSIEYTAKISIICNPVHKPAMLVDESISTGAWTRGAGGSVIANPVHEPVVVVVL